MKHSIRNKILLAILVVTAIGAVAATSVYYLQASSMIENNYRASLNTQLKQVGANFDEALKNAYLLTVQMACDEAFLAEVEQYGKADTTKHLEALVTALQDGTRRQGEIHSFYLVLPDQQQIITSKEYPICVKDIDLEIIEWYQSLGERTIIPKMMQDPLGSLSDVVAFICPVTNQEGSPDRKSVV